MERLSNMASLMVRSEPDKVLLEEASQQKLQNKRLQVLEDHTRVINDWKAHSKIDGTEFSKLINGPLYDTIQEVSEFMRKDPDFSLARFSDGDKTQQRDLTNKLLFKFYKRFPISFYKFVNEPWYFAALFGITTGFLPPVGTKSAVHFCLYAKSIFLLGTEKHLKYVERALRLQDLGCFGLTELAHGSNVQGCITTAHFDETNQCFVINTPHEKGIKFWIGGAAESANMCVVAANLIVKGKDYGIHMFIVQLRDHVNCDLMPGITIGDCGLKQGVNGVDNGFISFRNVDISLDNLLDKITQVSPSGVVTTLIARKSLRFAKQLSALSEGRVKICLTTLYAGMKASAIVLRFGAVRRQFGQDKYKEQSIIEYPGWQERVFPYVASNLIGSFAGIELNEMWHVTSQFVFDEKNDKVKEMHALISILKPLYTWWLLESLNSFRMAMGGLGFSKHAELGAMIDDYHVMCTWEGDNFVLSQQTSKYLLTTYMAKIQGKEPTQPTPSTDYIVIEPLEGSLEIADESMLQCPHFLHSIMKRRAATALQQIATYMQVRAADGVDQFAVFNEGNAAGLVEASNYYGELYVYRSALDGINKAKNVATRKYLLALLRIFAYTRILNSAVILSGYLNPHAIHQIQKAKIAAYDEVKYDIVKCMDDLGLEDHFVASPFGNKDGNIYGRFISKLLGEKGNFGKPANWRELWELRNAN